MRRTELIYPHLFPSPDPRPEGLLITQTRLVEVFPPVYRYYDWEAREYITFEYQYSEDRFVVYAKRIDWFQPKDFRYYRALWVIRWNIYDVNEALPDNRLFFWKSGWQRFEFIAKESRMDLGIYGNMAPLGFRRTPGCS